MNLRILFALLLLAYAPFSFAAAKTLHVKVEIDGVEGKVLDNVKAYLAIEQDKDSPRLSPAVIERLHALAPGEIRSALQAFGYYRPEIHSALAHEGTQWTASYRIKPGPPLKVTAMDLQITGPAAKDPAFEKLRANFPLKPGDVLDQQLYAQGKKRLQQLALDRGYFDARFSEHKIAIDLEHYEARITLHFDSGKRYRFGKVHFNPTVLTPSLLQRYVPFKEGEDYSTAKLLALQSGLTDTDYFSQVEVQPQRGKAANEQVPVDVSLKAAKRYKYSVGGGYGTDTGPRVRLGWENRYLNSKGHRLRADLRLATVASTLSAGYFIPLANPLKDQLAVTASLANLDTPTSTSRIGKAGVSHTTTRWGWRETASLSYQIEHFNVGLDTQTTTFLMPAINWTRVRADNLIYATNGSRVSLDLRGAAQQLVSDLSFLRLDLSGKYIHSVRSGGRIILRGEFGAAAVSDFSKYPASLRFFAGGDNSIRGFALDDLGPRDASGKVVGGHYLAVGSIEYDHRIHGNWSAAVFSDFGNAFNSFSTPIASSVGIGIRWRSPVGLIRVDLARALTERIDAFRIHVNIGPDF